MKLHGVPLSVHTRKVQLAMRAKGLDCEMNVVIPIKPETLPSNWEQLSPTGLIPVIEDGDFVLADSGAIVQYLDARYPSIPMIPVDPQGCGRAIWFDAYLGAFFRAVIHPLFHQRVVGPMRGNKPDVAVTTRVLAETAPRYLRYLDDQVDGDCLVGDGVSIADIAVGSNLVLFHYMGETLPAESYPRLSAYFRRFLDTPVFVDQLAAERPFVEQMGFSQDNLPA